MLDSKEHGKAVQLLSRLAEGAPLQETNESIDVLFGFLQRIGIEMKGISRDNGIAKQRLMEDTQFLTHKEYKTICTVGKEEIEPNGEDSIFTRGWYPNQFLYLSNLAEKTSKQTELDDLSRDRLHKLSLFFQVIGEKVAKEDHYIDLFKQTKKGKSLIVPYHPSNRRRGYPRFH